GWLLAWGGIPGPWVEWYVSQKPSLGSATFSLGQDSTSPDLHSLDQAPAEAGAAARDGPDCGDRPRGTAPARAARRSPAPSHGPVVARRDRAPRGGRRPLASRPARAACDARRR